MELAEWGGVGRVGGAEWGRHERKGMLWSFVHCTRKVATYVRTMHMARCCTVVCAPFTSVA